MALAVILVAGIAYQRHRAHSADAQAMGGPEGHGGPPGQGRPRAQLVVAATAEKAEVPVYFSGLGAVTPTDSVTVRSRVDGQLMRLAFTEGQLVKRGDLLAEIDPRPFQVTLEQAQGQLSRDEALLANAHADLTRYQNLLAQDSVARQTLDTQAALVRQYEGVLKVDQAAVDSAKLNLTYTRVTSPVSGRVGLRLVDPGNIIRAADTTGIVVVNSLQPIAVLFSVPESRVPDILMKLQAGEKLKTEAYDRARQQLLATGTLLTLDNRIDSTTGTVRLKALFDNLDYKLFPQQFVNAQLLIDTLHDAVVVPTAAIQHGMQGTFVYVIQGAANHAPSAQKEPPAPGEAPARQEQTAQREPPARQEQPAQGAPPSRQEQTAQREPPAQGSPSGNPSARPEAPAQTVHIRQVTTGPVSGDRTVIASGLSPGEQVVTEGSDKLTDGSAVTTSAPGGGRGAGVGGGGPEKPADGAHQGGKRHGGGQ